MTVGSRLSRQEKLRQTFWVMVWPQEVPFWGSQWARSQDCWETGLPSGVSGRAGMGTRDRMCLSFASHFSNPDWLPPSLGPFGWVLPLCPLLEFVALWPLCPSIMFTSQFRGGGCIFQPLPEKVCKREKFLRTCMSEKFSILPLDISDNLATYRILGWKFFPSSN